ncbi:MULTISPECIES: hybrid sensor histidine kinase/response regulator [Cyanophyceae]|uniref:hybrid sensor histidine kinase/response regulator n=1 Tax=Cyanophyceae TaxID=3028117 RepID=UPI001684B2E0|nr:PAS domain S-box protein [Nodosilinea sp. FACHB-131]
MRAEQHQEMPDEPFEGGEIETLLRSHDWSQTPLGAVETWSNSLKTAVQSRLAELNQAQGPEPVQQASVPLQSGSQTATSRQAAQADAFRVTLADALCLLTDAVEIQATAARILGEYLGASRVIYAEVLPGGKDVSVHKNYTNGVAELIGQYRLEDFGRNLTDDHRAGRTAIVADVANSLNYTDSEKAMYRAIDIAAHLDVPLIKKDQFVALLAVHQATPRAWAEREVQWVEETAAQTWAAVERARAEAALRESEAKYRTVFESIDEGFCIIEVLFDTETKPFDHRILQANPAFERQFGVANLADKRVSELVPGPEQYWNDLYAQVIRTGESIRTEERSDTLDRWFDVLLSRVGDAALHQVAIVFTDISARKQAEELLRQSESHLRLMIESAKDYAIFTLDLNGIVTKWNAGAERLLQYSEAEIIGHNSRIIFTPEDRKQGKAERELQIASTQGRAENERWHLRKDSSRFWGSGLVMPLQDEAGNAQGFVKIMQDKTAQRQAEAEREELLQREQAARETAERANQIKDEFLAVLSHELRSPLNPILGWTKLLRSGKLDAARQINALDTIERNAKLQVQLIEDLLDISRIMQGKLTLTATSVSLAFVIAAASETVKLAADAKNIQITLDLDPDVAPVSGDAARLQQMVWNLLTNAIKFTDNGGQVTVQLRQIATGSSSGHAIAQIRVIDTGKGISPQFLPHVFEHFRQEDGSTTRKFGGLGLGLAIVRQIVELHGGKVKAESRGEHQGAAFSVQLPVLRQATPIFSEQNQPQSGAEARLDNVQILLVDDDTDTREFQSFLLEQHGATVVAVASGVEALQTLEQWLPDIIVSDIGMVEMDGYRLIQQIRSRPPDQGCRVPAIALTAYAAEIDQEKALQAGFQAHLTKPLEPERFVREIVNLLNPSRV